MTGIPPELIKRKYDRVVLRTTEEKRRSQEKIYDSSC